MVFEFLTTTHTVSNNSYELNNFEFIMGSVPLIRCTWTNRRRAVPFDPDRAIDCPDALSLPFVTEFWWRWLLLYFPRLQNSTTHLCPLDVVHLALISHLCGGGGAMFVDAPARYLLSLLITYWLSLACCSCFSLTFSLRSLSTNLLFSLPSQPPSLSPDLLGLLITCLLS